MSAPELAVLRARQRDAVTFLENPETRDIDQALHAAREVENRAAQLGTPESLYLASQGATQEARVLQRMRDSLPENDPLKRKYEHDLLDAMSRGIEHGRASSLPYAPLLALVFRGGYYERAGDYSQALADLKEAASLPLPPDQSPEYQKEIKTRVAVLNLRLAHSVDEKSAFAREALTTTGSIPLGKAAGHDEHAMKVWASGGYLRLAQALSSEKQPQLRTLALHSLSLAESISASDQRLDLRRKDIEKAKEAFPEVAALDKQFEEATSLRHSSDKEEQTRARDMYRHIQEEAKRIGYDVLAAHAHHMEGIMLANEGHYKEAETVYQQVEEEFKNLHHTLGVGAVLRDRSSVARHQNEYARAHQLIDQSIQTLEDTGNDEHLGMSITRKARIFLAEGKSEDAEITARDGVTRVDQDNDKKYFQAKARQDLATVLLEIGKRDEALVLIEEALETLTGIENEHSGNTYGVDKKQLRELAEPHTTS